MNKEKLIVSSLAILLIISAGTILILYGELKSGSYKTQTQLGMNKNQELDLISNEKTNDPNQLPDEWTTYKNREYNFQINYPKEFEGQKIEVVQAEFKNDKERSEQIQINKIPDDIKYISGYTEADRKIMDFDYLNNDKKDSLFAITVYSNPSNLSLKDFVSNEISNMPEGIDDQRIINLNGNYGYRIVITKGNINMPSSIVYYIPAKDGKNIIGISSPIEIFGGGYGPDLRFEDFVKAYPKYSKDLQNMDSIWNIAGDEEELNKKYPEYKDFIEKLSAKATQQELNKRLTFDEIAYSFF